MTTEKVADNRNSTKSLNERVSRKYLRIIALRNQYKRQYFTPDILIKGTSDDLSYIFHQLYPIRAMIRNGMQTSRNLIV